MNRRTVAGVMAATAFTGVLGASIASAGAINYSHCQKAGSSNLACSKGTMRVDSSNASDRFYYWDANPRNKDSVYTRTNVLFLDEQSQYPQYVSTGTMNTPKTKSSTPILDARRRALDLNSEKVRIVHQSCEDYFLRPDPCASSIYSQSY